MTASIGKSPRSVVSNRGAMSGRPARPLPGKAVGQFLPKLTKRAFEKYGFATAAIATDWEAIVGADIAGKAAPERLSWPRRPADKDATADEGCGRSGATLIIRARPADALEVDYARPLLQDRLNAYFGYRAIAQIKVVQGDIPGFKRGHDKARVRANPRAVPEGQSEPSIRAEGVSDARLRAALERLSSNVTRKREAHSP